MADFAGSPLTGTAPLTVSFTDASSGTISGWWWSFGDGGSSSETNPSHGYTQTGVYTVSLTVSGACGSDVLTRTSYITVSSGYTATTTTITYTYDPLNWLTNAAYSDGGRMYSSASFAYAYDATGNRTVYTETITQTIAVTELIALHMLMSGAGITLSPEPIWSELPAGAPIMSPVLYCSPVRSMLYSNQPGGAPD